MKALDRSKLDIVSAFATEWVASTDAKSVLHVEASTFRVFGGMPEGATTRVERIDDVPPQTSYDLVAGDFPIGMGTTVLVEEGDLRANLPGNWNDILRASSFISQQGRGLFLLEPVTFHGSKGENLLIILRARGLEVNALFNAPDKLLHPQSPLTPVFAVVSRTPTEKLFVAELGEAVQARQAVRNCLAPAEGGDFETGMLVDRETFRGFHHSKIRQQIDRLETQYKTFCEFPLREALVAINSIKSGQSFSEQDNAFYVSTVGTPHAVSHLCDTRIKHHNYHQVVLRGPKKDEGEGNAAQDTPTQGNDRVVLSEYAALFYQSPLGRLILDSLTSGTFIPHLNKSALEDCLIAVPYPEEQRAVIATHNKLLAIKSAIDGLSGELALHPIAMPATQKRLDEMLQVVGALTEEDRVRSLVREGEGFKVEFKECLTFNPYLSRKDKDEGTKALKTVVAFLNSTGGVLLVGVANDGSISGLEREIEAVHENADKFLLTWKDLVKTKTEGPVFLYIDSRLVSVDGKTVLVVDCKPSDKACYLDGDFYIRTNPASDLLKGQKREEYIMQRFKAL